MTNRLVLNLSHTFNSPNESVRTNGLPSLNFASGPVLGNIGAPLRATASEDDNNYEMGIFGRHPMVSDGESFHAETENEESM